MAKKSKSLTPTTHVSEKERKITTLTAFGSHENMVDQDATEAYLQTRTEEDRKKREVVCADDDGLYVTEYSNLILENSGNMGIADANRYGSPKSRAKRGKTLAKLKHDFLKAKEVESAAPDTVVEEAVV